MFRILLSIHLYQTLNKSPFIYSLNIFHLVSWSEVVAFSLSGARWSEMIPVTRSLSNGYYRIIRTRVSLPCTDIWSTISQQLQCHRPTCGLLILLFCFLSVGGVSVCRGHWSAGWTVRRTHRSDLTADWQGDTCKSLNKETEQNAQVTNEILAEIYTVSSFYLLFWL